MESCYNNVANNRFGHGPVNPNCAPCNMRQQMPQKMFNDHQGRSLDVECVCKVNREKCHVEDPMDNLGHRFPVAMVYIPWQQWDETELYDPDCALMQGTIFKDLNKIFCGVRC